MGRIIEASTQVSANVRTPRQVDIDAQAEVNDCGSIPAAVAAYVAAQELGDKLLHKTVLTCTAVPISIADDAGVAQYGGVQVYTFPRGLICTHGAIVSGNLTLGTTGTIIDAFTGVNALGSAAAGTGATLVTTEATWLQSTANATASSKVAAITSYSIATQLTESGGRIYNGNTTPGPVYLNFAIADDVSHTAGTGSFTGVITLLWSLVGSW